MGVSLAAAVLMASASAEPAAAETGDVPAVAPATTETAATAVVEVVEQVAPPAPEAAETEAAATAVTDSTASAGASVKSGVSEISKASARTGTSAAAATTKSSAPASSPSNPSPAATVEAVADGASAAAPIAERTAKLAEETRRAAAGTARGAIEQTAQAVGKDAAPLGAVLDLIMSSLAQVTSSLATEDHVPVAPTRFGPLVPDASPTFAGPEPAGHPAANRALVAPQSISLVAVQGAFAGAGSSTPQAPDPPVGSPAPRLQVSAATSGHRPTSALGGRPDNSPSNPPPTRSPGAISGPGGTFFVPLAALLALLALAAPASFRRRREVAGFLAPTPFVCALERPG